MFRSHVTALLVCAVSVLSAAAPSSAETTPPPDDAGSFTILQYGRPVGREDFKIVSRRDSVILESKGSLTFDPSQPTRVKNMRCALRSENWTLLTYNAAQDIQGQVYRVGVTPGRDTTVTVYREQGISGDARVYYRPPGRLFVLDAMMYSLFQLMTQSLGPVPFEERTIAVLTIAGQDTVVEAKLRRLPDESIRWGSKPVTAHRMRFEQGGLALEMWTDPRYRVLRITHDPSGLAVERKAPAVKPAAKKPTPKPGG